MGRHQSSAGDSFRQADKPDPRPRNCDFCDITHGEGEIGSTNPCLDRDFEISFSTRNFVAIPDAAPIAPRHTLLLPRDHVLSFARLEERWQQRARAIVDHFFDQMPAPTGHVPCLFEHGSIEEEETRDCGITHAHLHLLYLPLERMDEEGTLEHFDEYPDLSSALTDFGQEDYYLFGQYGHQVHVKNVAEATELKCSMFLRKWIAGRLDRPELADYRRYQTNGRDDMLGEVHRTHELLQDIDPLQ